MSRLKAISRNEKYPEYSQGNKSNDELKDIGGHIGYSIRPTERNKGYNKDYKR